MKTNLIEILSYYKYNNYVKVIVYFKNGDKKNLNDIDINNKTLTRKISHAEIYAV